MATPLPDRIDTSDRLPRNLSPSRAKDYLQCPRMFYYKTILGISSPPTIHTLKGNLAHVAFERIFDHPRPERTVENALAYIEPALRIHEDPYPDRDSVDDPVEIALRDLDKMWEGVNNLNNPKVKGRVERNLRQAELDREVVAEVGRAHLLDEARDTTRGYFGMENPQVFDPFERELYVRAKVAGAPLHGFIDRLDRIKNAEGGLSWVITDFKTGKPPTDDRYKNERFFQLQVYALVLRVMKGETPALLRLVFTSAGGPSGIERMPVTDAMLDTTAKKVGQTWRNINRSAKQDDWPTRTGPLCNWCYFQDVCPEFNDGAESLLPEERELREGLLA